MKKLVECVPNFSEGRDKNVIDSLLTVDWTKTSGSIEYKLGIIAKKTQNTVRGIRFFI